MVGRDVFLVVDERVGRKEEIFDHVDSLRPLVERGVLVATGEDTTPAEKRVVWVTGRELRFDVADLERRLGGGAVWKEYNDEPSVYFV